MKGRFKGLYRDCSLIQKESNLNLFARRENLQLKEDDFLELLKGLSQCRAHRLKLDDSGKLYTVWYRIEVIEGSLKVLQASFKQYI